MSLFAFLAAVELPARERGRPVLGRHRVARLRGRRASASAAPTCRRSTSTASTRSTCPRRATSSRRSPSPRSHPPPTSASSGWAPPAVTPDPGSAQEYRSRSGARPRLGVERVRLPRRAVEQGVRLARERVQRVERRLRHPAGPPRIQDGQRRRRLGDERRRPRSTWGLGYIHGRYGTPVRRVGALAGRRLVLSARMPTVPNRRHAPRLGRTGDERVRADSAQPAGGAPRCAAAASGTCSPSRRRRPRRPTSARAAASSRTRRRAPRRVARRRRARRRRRPRGAAALAHPLLEDRIPVNHDDASTVEIRAGVELPARREEIELRTADGLTPRRRARHPGRPAAGRDPRHAASAAHGRRVHGLAHPPQGGRAAARPRRPRGAALQHPRHRRRPAARATGAFGEGVAERADVAAAMDVRRRAGAAAPVARRLVVRHRARAEVRPRARRSTARSCSRRRCTARATRSCAAWDGDSSAPIVALIPELDDYLQPGGRAERFAVAPATLRCIACEGGKHLWVGETQTRRVLDRDRGGRQPGGAAAADDVAAVGRLTAASVRRACTPSVVSARSGAG